METSIITLLLLLAVTPTITDSVFLGHPMITLNCTTDYAVPERIMHVSWLLDSRQPIVFRNRIGRMRIQNCVTIIVCDSGYKFRNPVCNNETLSNGNSYNIPLNENFCKVTVQYDDFDDFSNVMYPSTKTCLFSDPSIEFTVDMLGSSENFTVADPYEIKCAVNTDQVIHSDIVSFTWIGPNNETFIVNNGTIMTNNGTAIVNSRTIATTTTSVGFDHASTLHFLYLSEEDQGLYTCHVAILDNTNSESFEVGILIPAPNVSITVLNTQTVGSELSLKCDVTTVRGVTSSAEIVWMKNGTTVEDMNNSRINISPTDSIGNNYISVLQFSYLSEDDENEYICTVTILNTSTSESVELNSFNLPLPEVSVTALNQHVGSPLSLRCVVTTVKGITSGVDIIWKVNNTEIIERYDGNITEKRTSYVYYYNANTNLTVDDNNTVYQCQVIINASPLISNADNLTLNIIAPTDPTSSPPGNASLSIVVITTVLIIVALVAFVALSIFIGFIVCQNKGCCQNKRNTKVQWSRDEDFKYMPPIDDYSVIGKDAPSTCESVGEIQKVAEWIKDAQMPTINEECTAESTNQINDIQISDNNDECDSIITVPYVTNEEMLDHVCGHHVTGKKTRMDKFSVSTADSGIENELDNDSNKSLPPQTGSYISHQAVDDMHDIRNDQDKIEVSILQGDSNSSSNSEVMCDDSPNSTSSPQLDNSNLLSKFYDALIKQNPVSNEDDVGNEEPAVASLTLHSANTVHSANNSGHSVVLTVNQLPSSSANVGITTTAKVGSYVTGGCNGSNTVMLLLHPASINAPATAVNGSNIGCCIMPPGTENNSQPSLQYSCTGTATTVQDGNYIDHYAGSNVNQPMPHPTHKDAAPSSHPNYKVMVSTGYIDQYTATDICQASLCPTVAAAKTYADHHVPSSNNQPSSYPHYKKTGSYIDHYAAVNTSQPLLNPTIALAKNQCAALNTVAPEKANDFRASNTDQPLSHSTYKGTVSTGSYIDRYAASTTYQPSAHPTFTDTVMPTKDQSCVHSHAASNINQLSCPINKSTISTGSYIDYYSASNVNQLSPQPASTGSVTLAKPRALSNIDQPSSYSTYKDTVSTGSYVDHYATPTVYQPSIQHTSDTVVLGTEDGCDVDTHAVLEANPSYPTCKNMASTGSYIDRYAASNTELSPSLPKCTDTATTKERCDNPVSSDNQQLLCSSSSSALPTTQSIVLSANSYTATEAEGVYIDRYIASSIGNSHLVSLQSSNSEEHGDPCVTSNADHPFGHSTDDSTSEIGCYVDCYLASNNDNTSANPKSFDKSSDKLLSKKEMASCNSSFIDEDGLCPSPTTGVYVPYTTAMADVVTKDTSAYSASNNTLALLKTNQEKRKPADLFLPSNNNRFSYGLLNEDKSTFGSSTGDDCDTPNVGEYIAHDDLESLGVLNNYTSKLGGKHFLSRPAMIPNSASSHSTANNEHIDTAMQQSDPGKAAIASQAEVHNTNVNSIPPASSAAITININGYMTESDI